MPVIPFSSASRITEIDRETQEQRDAEEARRYRELADAKLKELMNTPVKRFDPQGGTSPIDVPEPVTGGWRVRTNGDPQPNADALPGGAFNRMGAPDIDDPMRDEQGFGGPDNWTPELAMPASPEGESFVGMGSGGPEQPVGDGGLSEDQIANIRDRFRKRKEGESTRELRARMLSAPNADQAAIDADLAERQGVNRLEVERNRDTFVAVDRAQAIDDLRKTAPKLRAWLDYNPANLEVAHDDVESLGWWEQTAALFSPGNLSIDKVGQALQSGFVDKIPEQLYGLDQMLGDANASIYKALPDWFPGKFGLVNEQVQRSLMADMKRQEMAAQGKANAPVGETWLERGIYGAAQSAPSTLVSLAITAVTRSPVVGSGSMGATTAGGAYGEARDEGKSLGDAFRYALTQGGIETATEFIPLKFLVDDLAKDSSFAKTFFRQAAAEGITEQAATFLQDASTFIELNPDKSLGEFLAERPNAALETLVASTIMSGVSTTVAKGVQAAGDQLDQNAKQKRAELLGKTFDAMAQNAKDSKLLKRLPEKYRELVNQVTKDGPLENVRIAPEAIVSLAQEKGVSVEQVAQAFRIDPNEMVTAMDAGEDVVIPAGNYAAGIAGAKKAIGVSGEEMHAAFAPNMRLRADDFTANEMAAMKEAFAEEQAAREKERAEAAKPLTLETLPQQLLMLARDARGGTVSKSGISGSEREMLEEAGYKPDEEGNYDLNALVVEADRRRAAGTLDLSMSQYDNSHITDWETKRKGRDAGEAFADAADRVRNTIREAVTATGLFNADAANTQAELVGSIVTTLAERTGQDPEALWKERGFDIVASLKGEQPAADSLPQSVGEDATPTQRLIDMRAKGMGNAEIASELYPDVDAKTATNRVKALASKHKAKIEERRAELEGAQSLDQGEQLEQTQRGTFTPREDRNVIRLFESANLSTLAHEGSHWYLDTLWRMSKTENPHPFVLEQLAAVLEWHGKSPNWDAMFNPDGSFTKEGVDLQEAFAESFEAYLMEGKAPTTALRSVFASFKQWLLSIYKGIAARIGGRARLNDEIRSVFDRMLATDEAIKAVHTGLARDGEAMAKAILDKQDPDGKWKPERREKFMERMRERYAAARERAEAALMARLMDEFQRTKQAAWRDEERQVKREVQAEVDARPEQRAYSWLTGIWRETDEDRLANEAADEAEAMTSLAQTEQAKAVERLQMVAERGERTLAERVSISAAEREAINASAAETGLSVREITDAVRSHKAAHPIAQGWAPLIYVRTEIEKGKIAHQYQNVPYTFSSDANGKQLEPGTAAYDRRVNSVARSMLEEVRSVFRRAANGDRNAQNILAQAGWYKAMRTRLRQEFGGLGDLFADLLGATSPNTPVRGNWANAVEALRRASRGDFDGLILQWEAWADNLDALETDLRAWFNDRLDEGLKKNKIKGLPEYKEKLEAVRAARKMPDSLLPTKESDAKYGFNGANVIRAMVDLWRVVKNADPDIARGGTAPKALNFSGNLIGFRSRATIDVWAARLLQRLTGGRRLPSMVESSLSGDMREDGSTTLQFGFGQDAFSAAVAAIRADPELQTDAGLAEINDDDLQAVVWFIEKEIWTINDWTNAAGEGGSFELEANLTGSSQQDRVKELRRIIDASAPTATVTAANQDTTAALKAIEDHELAHAEEIEELRKLESGEVKGSKKRMAELGKIVRPPAEATRLLANVERAKAKLEGLASEKVAAKAELAALEREVDRFVGGLSIQMSQDTQGIDFVPTDSDMARLGAAVRQAIYEADDKSAVLGSKALSTEGRYGGSERSLDLEVVAREGYNANTLWREMLVQAQAARQDSTFLSRVLRVGEKVDPLRHRPGVEIYLRSAASQEQLESVLADLAKEGVEFLTVIVDGRRMADSMGGAMPAAVGVRLQYVPEFEQRYGMDDLSGLDEEALAAKMQEKARELRAVADRVSEAVQGVSFAGQFWYETQTAFSHQYQDKIDALATGPSEGSTARAPAGQRWQGDAIRSGLESADRQVREAARGEPGGDVLGRDAGAGPQSLAQTVGEPRQLDAMGFYSAAQEAAQRVPDGIWQMGWQAARNSLAKGRGTSRPTFEELDQLGLDDAVAEAQREAGEPLKGAELRAVVLDIIDANRIMIERADAIFDPAKARAAIRKMNKRQLWDSLDTHTKGWFANRWVEARVERGVRTFTLDTSGGDTIVLQFKEDEMVIGYSGDPMRVSSVDIPVYRSFTHLGLTNKPLVETITIRLGVYDVIPASESKNLLLTSSVKYAVQNRIGELFADLGEETVIRKTTREDMVDSVPLVDMGTSGDGVRRLDPGDYDVDGRAKSGEIRMLLPARFHDDLTGSTHSGEPGEVVNILWSVRKDADGTKSLFLRQLQSDEAQQLRREKEELLDNRDSEIQVYMTRLGKTRAEAEEAVQNDIDSMLTAPLLARTSTWVNAGVRALVFEAAKQRMGSVSVPTAQTSTIIQGNADAAQHYETNVRGALEKIARQMGAEVKVSTVQSADYPNGATVYTMQITPQMRAKILSRGFPLFQTGDDKGRATPPPNLPPMRLNLQAVKEQYGEQALAEIPPDVAAYSAEANDVEAYVQIARDVRKTLNETPPKSLWKFLSTPRNIGQGEGRISYRGIRDTDGELLKIIGEKKAARGLIADPAKDGKRSRSYDMQQAIEAAWEAGYFDGEDLPTPAQFLDTLRADIDGQAPRYRRDDIPTVSTIAGAERWKDWFDQNDMDITSDVATLRAKLATVLTGQGTSAIGPDEAAEVFNGVIGTNAFPTGFDLLKALKQGPLRDKLIRELTEQRMIERNGDVFRDGTIMQEAEAYARNEVQHRQFEIELEALAEAAGKGTAGALAKQTAIENLRSKQVREVLNYTQWLTLERRWAEKAIKAAAKGDTAQAAEFARYRLINSYMYSEGKKLAEKIEKTRKHLLDYGKKAKQVRLFAAGKEYQETMNGLLSDYQFRNETKKGESQRAARAIWIRAQMASIDPYAAYQDTTKSDAERQAEAAEALEKSRTLAALAEGGDAKGYKSLTVDELMGVRDEADMIWRMATMADQLLKQGERRKLSLAAEDIAAEIETNQPNEKPPEPIETDSPGEGFKRGVMKYFAMHRTLQSLARQFAGGKDGGKFWAYIVKPLNEAFANLSTLRKQMGEDMKGLFSAYTEDEQKRMFRDRRTYDFRQAGGPRITLSKQGRLAFALNWGNDKNRRRLMDSLGLDEGMVGQVLDTLDKRDWDFVQKTWDYLDTWFPEANRVHEAVHGAPMSKEAPLEVATRFGIYRGGYYPIVFDPKLSSRTGQRQMEADAKSFTGQVGARNEPGFAKKRTSGKVTLPLRLSVLDVIASHLDKVATSIATEEALFDAGRIVKQPAVEAAIVNRHGREIYNVIVSTLVTAKFGLEGASGILAHLRNGATVVGLGWKVSTALLQPLGISNSIVRVGGFWIAKGYAAMGSDAVTIGRRASWATEKSEFMRNRRQANSPEMAALRGQLKAGVVDLPIPGLGLGKKAIDAVKNNAFAMMANVQFYSVDVPTWYGALFKARAAGMSEADAVASADQAVIDAQGGGELHQTAAMQTGAGTRYAAALRLLTNFMSYMVTTYNIATQRSRNARTPAQIAALAMDFVILLAIPVAGKMALDAWTKGGGDDDDEEDPLWEKYMREQAAFIFSPFVGISQIAGTARGEDAFGYRGPAGLGIFAEATNAGKAAAELDFDESFWRPANRTAGMIFHYPAGQLDASIRGANAYFNGETDNPAAFLVGPPPAN